MNQTLLNFVAATARLDNETDSAYDARVAGLYNAATGRRSYYCNARTLLWQMDGQARAEALLAGILATAPATYAVLTQAGNTDGSGGGLDLAQDATRAALAGFVTAGAMNAGEQARLLALSDTYRDGAPGVAPADVTAARLVLQCQAWEDATSKTTADAAAAYVTSVEAWRANGAAGDPPAFTLGQ